MGETRKPGEIDGGRGVLRGSTISTSSEPIGEQLTRVVAGREQVSAGPCIACGRRVWHTAGDAKQTALMKEYGGAIHSFCASRSGDTGA